MCTYRHGHFWFSNEGCFENSCLRGHYELCTKKHQIIKRKTAETTSLIEDQIPTFCQSEDKINFQPKSEICDQFDINAHIHTAKIDHAIELSDDENESDDENGRNVDYDTAISDLRQFLFRYDFLPFFSTNMTLTEVDLKNFNFELFDRNLQSLLSNDRAFGSAEYYPDQLNCLDGNTWLDDKILDGMIRIIAKKCLSCGVAIKPISSLWYHEYKVSSHKQIFVKL